MTVHEAIWQAIVDCDPAFDGQYFYGVISTGIFCRPSCKSRTPKEHNIRLFQSVGDARLAGFRPCKRCRPEEQSVGPDQQLIAEAKAILNRRYRDPLTLDVLAQDLAISPYHLHRVFRRVTGMTPANYLLEKRIEVARAALESHSRTITDIALEVGFKSASHFSTVFQRLTGLSPSAYRSSHVGEDLPVHTADHTV